MYSLLAQGSGGGGSLITLLVFALPLGLLFVFMRNQQKRLRSQQALQQSAEVGDEVLTTSGMFGTIVDEDEDEGTVTVEIAAGTRVKMLRAGIARRITEDDQDDFEDDDVEDEDEDDEQAAHHPDDGPDENAAGPIRS
jgi:preprotein translocase subunit YajC